MPRCLRLGGRGPGRGLFKVSSYPSPTRPAGGRVPARPAGRLFDVFLLRKKIKKNRCKSLYYCTPLWLSIFWSHAARPQRKARGKPAPSARCPYAACCPDTQLALAPAFQAGEPPGQRAAQPAVERAAVARDASPAGEDSYRHAVTVSTPGPCQYAQVLQLKLSAVLPPPYSALPFRSCLPPYCPPNPPSPTRSRSR